MRQGFLAGALTSSENHAFQTPPIALGAVRRVAPIGLDPCTIATNPTGAKRFYTPEQDGLLQEWTFPPGSLIYVNSPFGLALNDWTARCVEAGREPWTEVIQLMPARTDRKCFQAAAPTAQAMCLWAGRMTFLEHGEPAKYPAPFPVLFLYWGARADVFRKAFEPHGLVVGLDGGTG